VAKDLIIGGASNYDWNKVKYWVNSIKATGFKGDIVLVATNIDLKTLEILSSKDVKIHAYGRKTESGLVNDSQNAPHVERFIYIWDYLRNNPDYRFVTVTDTRDVIFQQDPSPFLEKHMFGRSLIASSEGLLYKDEPWGRQNMKETFGDYLYQIFQEYLICNVGTISGYYEDVRDFILMLFQQSINRPIPIVDQAVYNFLINQVPFKDEVLVATNKLGWAAQLGVTKGAIEAGAGDIGMSVLQNPSLMDEYIKLYQDAQPIINGASVTNEDGREFCIVHQWDRIPSLKAEIERKYGND
jgi:hypothetical protein